MTRIPFILLSTSDGSPLTGATPSVTISKDGAAFTAATNSPAEIGNGYYYINLTDAETTVTNNVIIRATATGAQPTAVVWEPEQDLSGLSTFDPTTDDVTINATQAATLATAAALTTVGDNVTAVKAKTDNLPATPAATGDAMTLTSETVAGIKYGLSTFDPSVSTVTINSTQAATFATAASITPILALLETFYSGMFHWEVQNNELTIYDSDGLVFGSYTLTKDALGNIIAVTPED